MGKLIYLFTDYDKMRAEHRLLHVTIKAIQHRLASGATGATRRSLNKQLDKAMDELFNLGGK